MNLPPDECVEFLRGIRNDDDFDGVGFDHTLLSSDLHAIAELDGWIGTSVNWDIPGGNALKQLMTQPRRDGELHFQFGAVRIPREILNYLVEKRYKNDVAYEIRPENGNDYHGHILLKNSLGKSRKQSICAHIVIAIAEIHRQGNQNG